MVNHHVSKTNCGQLSCIQVQPRLLVPQYSRHGKSYHFRSSLMIRDWWLMINALELKTYKRYPWQIFFELVCWFGIFCTLVKFSIGPQLYQAYDMSFYPLCPFLDFSTYSSIFGVKLNDIWMWKTIFEPFSDRRAGTDWHCDQNREKWWFSTFGNLRIWKL